MSKHDTGFIKILVLLFCLGVIQLTNSGCTRWKSGPTNHQINSPQLSGIIRGTKVFQTDLLAKKVFYLAINSILLKTPSGYAARQESFCSAIAIAPSVALTAAHCVENTLPEKINLVEGVSPWLSPLKPELWHQALNVLIHPKYKKKQPEFDLALIYLSTPLPVDSVTGISDNSPELSMITLAGYGFRINSIGSLQTELNDGNDLLKNNSGELFYITKILKDYGIDQPTFFFERSSTETVCIGDSGGPALIYDEQSQNFSVLGLLSGATDPASSQLFAQFADLDLCSGTPVYNNLRHPEIREWIDRSVNVLTNRLLDSD